MGDDDYEDYDDSDVGCVNCDEGMVMCCLYDLCRGAGHCLAGTPTTGCYRRCPVCNSPKKDTQK